ncbi:Hpt protein [Parvibaculum lavamentivorans DS-1]|uniref:Hpt protein n=1 Tax=Parvibaculum lavamentivorans (strain DS-1 / DSM 13023 / NCIMB 13966) TaxID=402881 RepID=A7HW43_PARL1|nr:Hpt domain-containing protein [Parvibaculum lavamentivorans]ABS64126.1 Hpt protein [Parvibaculum lavamentivorans DS-1]
MKTSTAQLAEHSSGVIAGPASRRPIDLVHLSKYTLGNRSLENELLGLFRTQAGVYLARLVEAADDMEWKNAAHSLKGSARGLGAWALAELAEEAEKLLAAADARPAIMDRIAAAIADVNAFIDSVAEA